MLSVQSGRATPCVRLPHRIGSRRLTPDQCRRNLRLLEQFNSNNMKKRTLIITILIVAASIMPAFATAAADGPAQTDGAATVRSAEDSEQLIEDVMAEANAWAQAGYSPEQVEAWIAERLRQAGMQVRPSPPVWDVFARAAWERDDRNVNDIPERELNPNGVATINGSNIGNPIDGREQAIKETVQPVGDGTNVIAAPLADVPERRFAAGGDGHIFVFTDRSRGRAGQADAGSPAVRLRAGKTIAGGRQIRRQVDPATTVVADLRSRSGRSTTTTRSAATGIDPD